MPTDKKITDADFAELKKRIGNQIQKFRKDKGMTQQDLAGATDMDRVAIGYIEQGVRAARLRSLLTIARELNVDIKEFF